MTPRRLRPGQVCQVLVGGSDLAEPRLLLETSDVLLEAPNWTLDGTQLVLNGDGALWTLDLEAPGAIPARVDLEVAELNNDHVLDPDGVHVYVSATDGHIHRARLAGGPTARVTPEDGCWHFLHGVSPDGTRIAYVEMRDLDGPGRLAVLDVGDPSGTVRHVDVGPGHVDGPEFSPDGAWVYANTEAFTTAPGHAQLARVPARGGTVERLVVSETVDWFPHVSPDGVWASYVAFSPGTLGHPADVDVEVRVVSTADWSHPVRRYPVAGGQGTPERRELGARQPSVRVRRVPDGGALVSEPRETRRAVVAGATGFIGPRLVADLSARGHEVVTIGRRAGIRWSDRAAVTRVVDGADLLVNLAGRSVGCRYTDANRDEIYDSRIATTEQLHEAVTRAANPPRLWMNASTATIYRHAMDRPQTEADGELGEGFSVDVARGWERAFLAGDLPQTRRVALRMAIVLGDGPAFTKLLTAARLGIGGAQHDGRWLPHRRYRGIGPDASGPTWWHRHHPTPHGDQRFSWIHVDDLLAAVAFLDDADHLSGPVNLAAPGTATNARLMSALRTAAGTPFGLPAPRWFLEVGMTVLRQESELVLKSRWVVPERLTEAGFRFRWPVLEDAVADVHAGLHRR